MKRSWNTAMEATLILVWVAGSAWAAPVGTAFTYQGQLKQAGVPVNGTADIKFSLRDADTLGVLLGTTAVPGVVIANGLFQVDLDFGVGMFDGQVRYLEVAVRMPSDPTDTAPFTTFERRQRIAPVPYALYASEAGSDGGGGGNTLDQAYDQGGAGMGGTILADAGPVTINGDGGLKVGADVAVDGRIGIGNDQPQALLHLSGAVGSDGIVFPDGTLQTTAFPPAWLLKGNSLTDPLVDFVGTIDNRPLNLRVNSALALRLEPAATPNLIGGSAANTVAAGATGATIGGGGTVGSPNQVQGSFGVVGGGSGNVAADDSATVGGGSGNIAGTANGDPTNSMNATVGGGQGNLASGASSTVGGGSGNEATGDGSTIAGGLTNTAHSVDAFIGGGSANVVGDDLGRGEHAVVAGGTNNQALGTGNFIGGGENNTAGIALQGTSRMPNATVAGGRENAARGSEAFVGGGSQNSANGEDTVVAGGRNNTAAGDHSTVAGV